MILPEGNSQDVGAGAARVKKAGTGAELQTGASSQSVVLVEILEELERIFVSSAFKTSRQSQRFLRHVVELSMEGAAEALHERAIGEALFGRDPHYDTTADPVVRIRASEVRKRLAQYYLESGKASAIRIELPPGSYQARFERVAREIPQSPPREQMGFRTRWLWATVGAVAMAIGFLVVLGSWSRGGGPKGPLEEFWHPVFVHEQPVLICSGHPVVYFLSSRVHQQMRSRITVDRQPGQGPYIVPLRSEDRIAGNDIVPVTDQYIGVGDSMVQTRLASLFSKQGKPFQLRFGGDLTFGGLRNTPVVLLGAFSNRWTLSVTNELRFVFEIKDNVKRIVDRRDTGSVWEMPDIAPDGKVDHDYAIVSRVFESKTGQVVVSAAGVTQYGTASAGEFLTSEKLMSEAARQAPAGWQQKNLQVLLHTTVVGGTAGPPEIVKVHTW